ncbi:MAG: hypothetical protein IKL18_06245 [Oscillospiraceae bacterium]|nr:hypothetical protein [Oscillospiraceae bacterium]MBR6657750.1 hypothetical protein [Oscillospiraceae bacterium]
MDRRRALLNSKLPPLYLFKEGEGMLVTVTSKSSNITINNNYISYDLYRNIYLNVKQSFTGYKKLCFEGKAGKYRNDEGTVFYQSASVGYGSTALTKAGIPQTSQKLPNDRGIVALDISALSGDYYVQFGETAYTSQGSYIDYIYNIWLE